MSERARPALAATLALALTWGGACSRRPTYDTDYPPGGIVVHEDRAALRAEPAVPSSAGTTRVYVDVENRTDRERLVGVDGRLRDAGGRSLDPLAGDELRVPAGATRTFALVAGRHVPDAAAATFRVLHATALARRLPVEIEAVVTTRDGERLIATASARSVADAPAKVSLLASFYDEAGRVLTRPAAVVRLAAREVQPVRFEGPAGAARAVVYASGVTD